MAKAEIAKRVGELLEVVRLGDFGNRKPAQLSGGQQQRVALARALVNYPSALLLDEPLGALDLKLRQAMQLELKRIQREVGITFVFVTHDQEEALTMSDRIAVMSEGRVEQIGSPEEIYHQPASEFVAGFIGMANLLPATVDGASGAGRRHGNARRRHRASTPRRPTGSTVGDPATLMIRPERMHLSVDEPRAGLAPSRPRSSTSCSRARWCASTCAAPDGSALVAHVGPEDDLPLLRPGDRVWVVLGAGRGPTPAPRRPGGAGPRDAERSTNSNRRPRGVNHERT